MKQRGEGGVEWGGKWGFVGGLTDDGDIYYVEPFAGHAYLTVIHD